MKEKVSLFSVNKKIDDLIIKVDLMQMDLSSNGITVDREEILKGKWKGGNVSVFSTQTDSQIYPEARRLGLNTVTIPVKVHADTATHSEPYLDMDDWNLTKSEALKLHKRGLNVIIEPYPYVDKGNIIETNWNPDDKDAFFLHWGNVLKVVAEYVNENNLNSYYIASNLVHMESLSDKWISLIAELREVSPNANIIYRTNWWYKGDISWDPDGNQRYQEKLNNPLWGSVDIIAFAAYFEVSDKPNPTKEELMQDIVKTTVHNRYQNLPMELKAFYDKWDKPIFFGELGIPPYEGAPVQPWASDIYTEDKYNEDVQANWFDAWNDVMSVYDWWKGYSIYTINDRKSDYDPLNKKAENSILLHDLGRYPENLKDQLRDLRSDFEQSKDDLNDRIDNISSYSLIGEIDIIDGIGKIDHTLNTLDYHVLVTPLTPDIEGSIGEISVTKELNSFTIKTTGSLGSKVSYIVFK